MHDKPKIFGGMTLYVGWPGCWKHYIALADTDPETRNARFVLLSDPCQQGGLLRTRGDGSYLWTEEQIHEFMDKFEGSRLSTPSYKRVDECIWERICSQHEAQLAEAKRQGAMEALTEAEKQISSIGQGVHDGTIDVIDRTSLMWLTLNRVNAIRARYETTEERLFRAPNPYASRKCENCGITIPPGMVDGHWCETTEET